MSDIIPATRSADSCDAIVIGGGFYGAMLAVALSGGSRRVALIEKEPGLLKRASFANQARVHNGYHYPRSILTSMRSRVNYARFREDFADAIDETFTTVYAVAKRLSKVNAQQYLRFCRRIGAQISPAPKHITSLFDPTTIEAAFVATECAFDARKLAALIEARIEREDVEVHLGTVARKVEPAGKGLRVLCEKDGSQLELSAERVFNCTYSAANHLLDASGFPLLSLKHELTEIALVEVPDEFRNLGITVMDGPFFSVMPFPAAGMHSMTHVRYTPHATWLDRPGMAARPPMFSLNDPPRSTFPYMVRDIARYVPGFAGSSYRESLWEVKTVLPQSEHDDSRPILLHRSPSASGMWTLLGAKIDGAYDVLDNLLERPGLAVGAE